MFGLLMLSGLAVGIYWGLKQRKNSQIKIQR
jgi:hypothetical protein